MASYAEGNDLESDIYTDTVTEVAHSWSPNYADYSLRNGHHVHNNEHHSYPITNIYLPSKLISVIFENNCRSGRISEHI
jgi:hypothetical protein